ncbi:MAG: bifunctional hexulose-6-phosphate synthase/ribonuclease regulator [Methanomassiliicoccales archaeon]|nr:MAG: bifunctional hexulose-6-phosphate synthase/ribonuclease regulator [Methanomassiliicoccales archaeon]
MPEKPILQVALDLMNLHRILKIAEEAVEGGVDWLEAGTPLIKSEGMDSVRELKKRFPGKKIVADMKTMDTGAYEVEMASKAGADVVIVMAQADDSTIRESVRAAERYGTEIMADLIGVEKKAERAKQVQDLGVHYLCVHVSIDEQMLGKDPLAELREVSDVSQVPVAVAGGLNSETAVPALEAGASIIIVGGAIVKAPNVTEATSNIRKAIDQKEIVKSELYKKYKEEELYEVFSKVSTPNIADAMQKMGTMEGIVPRINHGTKMVGQALTVKTADGDWAKPVEAIEKAKKGDVVVVDVGGGRIAIWGELASWSCRQKGISGVVIDGAARDIDTILDIDFPVFSRHIAPRAGEPKGHGEIGCEIEVGGQRVRTGDWIVGDESGVVVIPKGMAVEMANRAMDVFERENRIREEIQRGKTLSSVLELEKWETVD